MECEQNLGNNQIYTHGLSLSKYFITERHSYSEYLFFQQKHRMQASVYTSNVTRRQRRMLSRDAGYICVHGLSIDVAGEVCKMRIFVAIVFVRSTVPSTDWPLDIKKPDMCSHTRKYGCINAENKMCMIPFWFASVNGIVAWSVNISHTEICVEHNIHTCRKTTEFILLMIPWSGYCLAWRYKFLPRGRAETLDSRALHVAWKSFPTMLCLQSAR